ncbi:hypothetical protein BGZ90_009474 [Linnemannia elongata]|nr:hypothetical protein BGZ90_009474 [Linnemannia elongata]
MRKKLAFAGYTFRGFHAPGGKKKESDPLQAFKMDPKAWGMGVTDSVRLRTLDALLQCHQLEDFRVPRISVTDLKLTPQPWVCHGLKRLSVFFASDPVDPSADSLVFEQLSRLQWLESLDVSQQHEWFESIVVSQHHNPDVIWSPSIESTVLQTVKLRLDSGLEQLATLTRLRSFIFYNTGQNMEGDDVE